VWRAKWRVEWFHVQVREIVNGRPDRRSLIFFRGHTMQFRTSLQRPEVSGSDWCEPV
jgi:hypothetical protein